jgi:polyisoprenoid-binding protein YceI
VKILPILVLATSLVALHAHGAENKQSNDVPAASTAPVPAGDYTLDRAHASLLFRVDHLGFSHYTARFKRFDAQLHFDPRKLTSSQLNVTVDATSLETDFPDPAKIDFNAQLQGQQWLNTAKYPQMTYRSTKIESTGPKSVKVTGDLTLRGITKPVVLNVTYNGGYAGHPMDPHARVGFSARGKLKRSDFGMNFGIPAPGTTMGVGDEVEIIIECEFTGPPLKSDQVKQ